MYVHYKGHLSGLDNSATCASLTSVGCDIQLEMSGHVTWCIPCQVRYIECVFVVPGRGPNIGTVEATVASEADTGRVGGRVKGDTTRWPDLLGSEDMPVAAILLQTTWRIVNTRPVFLAGGQKIRRALRL